MTSASESIRSKILALVKEYHTAKFAPKTFDPDKDMVHYAGRVFDAEEIVNLVDASLDFYLTANRYAERFETEFADYLGYVGCVSTHRLDQPFVMVRYASLTHPTAQTLR